MTTLEYVLLGVILGYYTGPVLLILFDRLRGFRPSRISRRPFSSIEEMERVMGVQEVCNGREV